MSSSDVEILSDEVIINAPSRREDRAESARLDASTRLHNYRTASQSPRVPPRLGRALGPTGTEVLELSDGSDDSDDDDEIQVTGYRPSVEVSKSRERVDESSEDETLPGPFGCFKRGTMSVGPMDGSILGKNGSVLSRLGSASGLGVGGSMLPSASTARASSSSSDDLTRRASGYMINASESLLTATDHLKRPLDKISGVDDHDSASHKTRKTSKGDKEAEKERKAAEKQAKQSEKQREQNEKQARKDANKIRTSSKTSTVGELTVHISGTIFGDEVESDTEDESEQVTPAVKKRRITAKRKLAQNWVEIVKEVVPKLEAHNCVVEAPENPRRDVLSQGAVRWTRLCDRKWDDDRREFVPLGAGNEIIVEEDTRLVFITALELSKWIARGGLVGHIKNIMSRIPRDAHLFIMHFGLDALYREIKNAGEAVKREAARARVAGQEPDPLVQSKQVGIGAKQPSKSKMEYELMKAQTLLNFKMIAVDKVSEGAEYLEQISYDVGQKPYQRHKLMHTIALGTGDEKIVSGQGLKDTYIKMLHSIRGVPEACAKSIVAEYPTLRSLYEAWARCGSEKERQNMLVGISRLHNTNGLPTNRNIGSVTSAVVYNVFNNRDPNAFL